MTEIICVLIAAVCIISAAAAVLLYRRRTVRIMRSLDKMIEKAIDGCFTEENINETMLSSVEAKLAKYLSASELSAKNTASEKEKIKQFISDISHQTKTPLSNILLYTELLQEQELNEQARSCAEKTAEQAEKLSFLISVLVKLSRLETGVFKMSLKRDSLMPMLENTYCQYLPKAEEKGIKLLLEPTSAKAVFDEKWVAEAVGNIVDNAVKYTSDGHISIKVNEYEMFSAIEISDSGMGIPEAEQGKVFSRFYRSAAVSRSEGLGIGLYLAREIISGCGGYIKVSSEIGKGSVFYIYLPK